MKYMVVTGRNLYDFQQFVVGYLNSGWKLQGGVEVQIIGNQEHFYQAMYKEE